MPNLVSPFFENTVVSNFFS